MSLFDNRTTAVCEQGSSSPVELPRAHSWQFSNPNCHVRKLQFARLGVQVHYAQICTIYFMQSEHYFLALQQQNNSRMLFGKLISSPFKGRDHLFLEFIYKSYALIIPIYIT